MASSFDALLVGLGALKSDVEQNLNLQTDYTELKEGVLNNYVR